MNFCKSLCFSVLTVFVFSTAAFSQQRPRIVPSTNAESQPINQPTAPIQRRPTLTTPLIIQTSQPLIKKTGSSQPLNAPANATFNKNFYSVSFSQKMLSSIQSKIGIPYRYGSMGPNSYDCSGLVWSVFKDAGYSFERSSARNLWQSSVPVEGDARFKFGTLVFFNGLGHIGIVVDENHFYHASSSKGVTLSKLDGYWAKRIVGFRQLQTPEMQK
jgi:cell wall-associated NlpC family hydrolase